MNKNFLYITSIAVSSLLALSACSDESGVVDNNTNEGKTTIDLNVGMAGAAATRAITTKPASISDLSTLPVGTTLYMVMKSEVDAQTKWTMTKAVTGTVDANKESSVRFSDPGTPRYWDDCGARDAKVSVYSICTPGGTPNTPTIGGKSQYAFTGTPSTGAWSADYTPSALTISDWTVGTNQATLIATTFADQDLCYSNNVSYNSTGDHRLKFDNLTSGKFDKGDLVFYHALTKVTVNMTAGDGFEVADSKKAFQSPATATIHGFKVQGDFDIPTGVITPKGVAVEDITTFMTNDDKTGTEEVVTRSAIIMPGRTLNAADKILTVDGDGSTYNVTAAELVAAMPASKVMQQGTEYIINVRISKTGIKVAATIADWENVEGTNYSPLINFTQSYGAEGTDFGKGFSLYLSQNAGVDASLEDNFAKGTDVSYAASKYTLDTPLYWPNHQKHYLFRGVWPLVGDEIDGTQTLSTNVGAKKIAVENVAYAKGKYPSDLMLGYPRKAGETCESHGKDVTTLGICATEGSIAMNFQYVMSQVEVNLSTSEVANKVIFDERTTVEIIGGYYDGFILFKNGASDFTDKTTGDYGMHKEGDTNKKFHDAVIPQSLEGLKFRITVTDSEGKSDKYETVLGIKEIEVTPSGGSARKIDTWEPGKKYIYNLYITKTGIKVTATLTDWITVTADENVWF